jgi:tRNA (adenine57-N1/adenine58-N1)-methyltransferase
VCCFSPCIEQVLSTHAALRKEGFTNITTYDLYYRNWEARPLQVKSVDEACERLRGIRQRLKEGLRREPRVDTRKRKPVEGDGLDWRVVARDDASIATHTSFLTFGELMPLMEDSQTAKTESEEVVMETAVSEETDPATIDM